MTKRTARRRRIRKSWSRDKPAGQKRDPDSGRFVKAGSNNPAGGDVSDSRASSSTRPDALQETSSESPMPENKAIVTPPPDVEE